MVLIISDGGMLAGDIEKQLEFYREQSVTFFTDFRAAGSRGRGSVIVGSPTADAIRAAIRDNGITDVIDAVEDPGLPVSFAAQKVCGELGITYVKYLNIEQRPGLKLCLYYSDIADKIRNYDGNALLYASARTVSAIAAVGKDVAEKMYVPVLKSTVFDTSAALEYSIPLLNIIETEWLNGEESVRVMIKKTGADLIICDNSAVIDDKAAAAFEVGIPIILTHSMGMEYKNAAATARDAVIAIHEKQIKNSEDVTEE